MNLQSIVSQDGAWTSLPQGMPEIARHGSPSIRPREFAAWALDRQTIEKTLAAAPSEAQVARQIAPPRVIELPLPDGRLERFAVSEASVMEPGLAAKFPGFKTYAGQGVDDPAKSIRCELTDVGFTAQIFAPEGVVLIEPYNQFDQQFYAVVRKDVLGQPSMRCLVGAQTPNNSPINPPGAANLRLRGSATARTTDNRKTYRLAIATTPNFTAVNGGDAATLSRIVVMTNRLNQIYTQDFNIAFTLVANQNLIIFNSTTNIPPTAYNENNAGSMLTVNQSNLNARIGSANYDAGHVVGAVSAGNANGVAGAIGNICTSSKGQGVSLGDNTPTDFFVVDYVAHELGHQFGGRHLFNSCNGTQGDSSSIAVEPGSGITIMCYAGICGPDNTAAHSIPYFNTLNIDQIVNYTSTGSGTCFTSSVTGNTGPTASAGLNFTIPPSTPYVLTASATDPNGDTLTYSWEQVDGGPVRSLSTTTGTALNAGPLVIPRTPTASPSRTFPPLTNLLNNTANAQDLLPPSARTMNFRCTVRDPNGGVDSAGMVLTIAGTTPFAVTSPNTAVSLTPCPQTITWTVAGTNAAPYNASNVKITLSTDGGITFPIVLAASTPNTGSAIVTLPNIATSQARIRIEAINNIFFDVGNTNFTIAAPGGGASVSVGSTVLADTTGNGNSNDVADPGESDLRLTISINNVGGAPLTNAIGTLSSLTPTATVVPASASRAYGSIPTCSATPSLQPFVLSVDPAHPCGSPINLQLQLISDSGTTNLTLSISTGTPVVAPLTLTFSGPPIAIPDNSTTGVDVVLPVTGISGTVTAVTFSIDGSLCSTDPNSTTVGISHPAVGSLVGTLFAPSGTNRVVFNRPGTFSNVGSNFCNTQFRDDAALPLISGINTAGAPYSNAYRPTQTLAGFNGVAANGNWRFRVADTALGNTGFVRAVTLRLTVSGVVCASPMVVPPSQCNPADICGSGATFNNGTVDIGPDNELSIDDFIVFLAAFSDAAGCPTATGPCNPADVCGSGATYTNGTADIGPDGDLTIDDFIVFLAAFSDATGCP